jgi:uncharacterized protein (TIGR02270 family)
VLLGDRAHGLRALQALGLAKESPSLPALQLGLLAVPPDTSRQVVRQLVAEGAPLRTTIRAAAWAGDVLVVPWLIKHMADDRVARLAGEAFTFLTGANLALLDLERQGASPAEGGPNDNPQDDDVALEEDDSLPWPDAPAVQAWWQRHSDSMPMGVRCFAGAPASEEQCLTVLKSAGQRQRYAASLILSLMRPGRPLFNVAAPAHRQQRLLGLPQK